MPIDEWSTLVSGKAPRENTAGGREMRFVVGACTRFDDNLDVAEQFILVTGCRILNRLESRETQLIGKNGRTITLNDLSIGDRVIVNGLKLADDIDVGLRIQIDADGDESRRYPVPIA